MSYTPLTFDSSTPQERPHSSSGTTCFFPSFCVLLLLILPNCIASRPIGKAIERGWIQRAEESLLEANSVLSEELFSAWAVTHLYPVCSNMVVPFANRAAVAVLPGLALLSKKPATVKEVIEDFSKQVPSPHKARLECIQLVKGKTIKVHFPSANIMEDILHSGLTFRGHPLEFKDPSQHRWVTLLDLPYGIPPASISSSLVKYGKIKEIKSESHLGVYTGVRLLLMDVTVSTGHSKRPEYFNFLVFSVRFSPGALCTPVPHLSFFGCCLLGQLSCKFSTQG